MKKSKITYHLPIIPVLPENSICIPKFLLSLSPFRSFPLLESVLSCLNSLGPQASCLPVANRMPAVPDTPSPINRFEPFFAPQRSAYAARAAGGSCAGSAGGARQKHNIHRQSGLIRSVSRFDLAGTRLFRRVSGLDNGAPGERILEAPNFYDPSKSSNASFAALPAGFTIVPGDLRRRRIALSFLRSVPTCAL